MSYIEEFELLQATLDALPPDRRERFDRADIVGEVSNIAIQNGLVGHEIGEVYGVIRRIITGEFRSARDSRLAEKLSPEHQKNAEEIMWMIEKIFAKLDEQKSLRQESPPKPPPEAATAPEPQPRFPPPPPPELANPPAPPAVHQFPQETAAASKVSGADETRHLRGVRTMPSDTAIVELLSEIGRGTNFSQKELQQAFENVPEEVKEAVTSVKVAEKLRAIGSRFTLHIDELGELGSETGLLMLGLAHPSVFVDNIARRLKVSRDRAAEIGRAVNEEIFRPIREELKGIYGIKNHPTSTTSVNTETSKGNMQKMGRPTNEFGEKTETDKIIKDTGSPPSGGITASKLSGVVRLAKEETVWKASPEPPKKYVVDPYREPID